MSKLAESIQRNQSNEGTCDVNVLRKIHHGLMSKYGWINFEEFKSLPIPTLYGLLMECMDEVKETREELNKTTGKMNVGSPLPSRPR